MRGLPLYTSDTQFLESANTEKLANLRAQQGLDEAAFKKLYEISRTGEGVRAGGYTRVALQFPDELLGDSMRVYELVLEGKKPGELARAPRGNCREQG